MADQLKYKTEEIPLTEQDYLQFLKTFSSDLFDKKYVKICAIIVFTYYLISILITIYFAPRTISINQMGEYSGFFLDTCFFLIAIYALSLRKIITNFENELTLWDLHSAGEKVYRNIKTTIEKTNICFIVCNLVMFLAMCLCALPLSRDMNCFYPLYFSSEFFPNQKAYLDVLFRLCFPLVGYVMAATPLQVLYSAQHGVLQTRLFQRYLKEIDQTPLKTQEEELIYNETYQEIIKDRLVFCIKRYQELFVAISQKNKNIGEFFVCYAFGFILVGLGLAIYVAGGFFTFEYYLRVGMTLLATFLLFCIIMGICEMMETEGVRMFTIACEMKWFTYNYKNRKLYLIFLMQLGQKMKLSYRVNYAINHEFALKITRVIYSYLSLIITII